MKKKTRSVVTFFVGAAICLLLNAACAPGVNNTATRDPLATPAPAAPTPQEKNLQAGQLPVRYQKPAYMLGDSSAQNVGAGNGQGISIPIGADISSNTGPVPLRDIMKRLASLKGMNISWASDVDQLAEVDVDIRAEDDFFKSLDNILRQKDYYHEVQGNTIVVKYRETRKFHVAMPFLKSSYTTGVGGDVLGGGQEQSNIKGNIQLTSDKNDFDVWANISTNLDQILGIWEETAISQTEGDTASQTPQKKPATTTKRNVQAGKGYYSIDKPIGLITVTAPRPLVEKIDIYFNNLKTELYRQVSIEAKIVEVIIDDTESKGIDWSALLNTSVSLEMFGPSGIIYAQKALPQIVTSTVGTTGLAVTGTTGLAVTSAAGTVFDSSADPANITTNNNSTNNTLNNSATNTNNSTTTTTTSSTTNSPGRRMISNLALPGSPFAILISALETQGATNILANPKISVMNGQPALINVGENIRFIEKVETTVSDSGAVSTSVTTNSLMSGLGMSVIASIMENNELILSVTPVTSTLRRIDERIFGSGGLLVQLPTVNVREMNTLVRVKSGDILMIGGLIDNIETDDATKVPILGDIPGLSRLFSHSTKVTKKKELVILLQPKIL
ncbi:MAG: type II and III secretion system protein [Desulfurivibrionaceae bacterium]